MNYQEIGKEMDAIMAEILQHEKDTKTFSQKAVEAHQLRNEAEQRLVMKRNEVTQALNGIQEFIVKLTRIPSIVSTVTAPAPAPTSTPEPSVTSTPVPTEAPARPAPTVEIEPDLIIPVEDPVPPAESVEFGPLPPAEPLPPAQKPLVLNEPTAQPEELTDEQELNLLGDPEPTRPVDVLPEINPLTGLPQTSG